MKVIAAVVAALGFVAPVAAAPDAVERGATLRLAGTHPVALRGSGFLAGEQVTVVAQSAGRTRSRTVVAGEAGRFLVRFDKLPFDRCQGFRAVARGVRGSVARFKLPDLLDRLCPPRM